MKKTNLMRWLLPSLVLAALGSYAWAQSEPAVTSNLTKVQATVKAIDVGQHATVSASVLTSTIAPTNAIANTAAPFTLVSSVAHEHGDSQLHRF